MKRASIIEEVLRPVPLPLALQMRAISTEEPGRLMKSITGAILGCGGWVLSRSASDSGLIDVLLEFERRSCLEIYSILVAAGVELSESAHLRFTELCQCTRLANSDCGEEIVSVDLEVVTIATRSKGTNAGPQP